MKIPFFCIMVLLFQSAPVVSADKKTIYNDTMITIQSDNDFYFTGRDEDYSFGQRLTIGLPFKKEPKWVMGLVDWFPIGQESKYRRYSITFAQNVFTPKNLKTSEIVADQRPYAGYGYLGVGYSDPADFHTDLFNIAFGGTGDISMAQLTQDTLHGWKGIKNAAGWDNQVGTEPTVMLQFTRLYAGREGSPIGGESWDLTSHINIAIGSPHTHLSKGVTLRFGTGIDREPGGPPMILPQLTPHGDYSAAGGLDFTVFAGIEARVVAYDFSLDGALFASNPHTVDKKWLTGQAYAGVTLYAGKWRLAYTHVVQEKTYKLQARRHSYGSVTVSRYF